MAEDPNGSSLSPTGRWPVTNSDGSWKPNMDVTEGSRRTRPGQRLGLGAAHDTVVPHHPDLHCAADLFVAAAKTPIAALGSTTSLTPNDRPRIPHCPRHPSRPKPFRRARRWGNHRRRTSSISAARPRLRPSRHRQSESRILASHQSALSALVIAFRLSPRQPISMRHA
jgi:hypothetical protein